MKVYIFNFIFVLMIVIAISVLIGLQINKINRTTVCQFQVIDFTTTNNIKGSIMEVKNEANIQWKINDKQYSGKRTLNSLVVSSVLHDFLNNITTLIGTIGEEEKTKANEYYQQGNGTCINVDSGNLNNLLSTNYFCVLDADSPYNCFAMDYYYSLKELVAALWFGFGMFTFVTIGFGIRIINDRHKLCCKKNISQADMYRLP